MKELLNDIEKGIEERNKSWNKYKDVQGKGSKAYIIKKN